MPGARNNDRVDYDTELQRHNEVLCRAWDIRPHNRVLDVGCGAGQTTRDAGRLAKGGGAMGVDISAQMITRATELTEAEGLRNVAFAQGDAAVYPFPSQHFDVVISRFGTMFFASPVAAFANLARSLRQGGRLVMMVWQAAERNEWAMLVQRAFALAMPASSSSAPEAFSLGDPNVTERTLNASGFVDITCTDVQEPVYYGPNIPAALQWVCGFSSAKSALQKMAPADRDGVLAALRESFAEHDTGSGIWLGSRAWLVTAGLP